MGYAIAFGACFGCGRTFGFNPVRVPAYQGQPVCQSCMDRANAQRSEMGLPPHPILPDAYEPAPEEELP